MPIKIQVLLWDVCKNVAVLNYFWDPNLLPLNNWMFKVKTDINEQYKNPADSYPLRKDHPLL